MSMGVLEEPVQASGQLGELRELPLVSLRESPWNPRHYFSETALDELVGSIQGKGITTPLIVRPTRDGFEIGAGARRYRAAQRAGLNLVPCIVRVLDDEQFLELISFENLQREDPHPLDEAAGFRNYLDHAHCSVEELARKVGKSRSQVYGRLQLAKDLIPDVTQACWDGKITASHAMRLAPLPPSGQEKMLKRIEEGSRYRPITDRELRRWIEDDFCLEMKKAPFDLSDRHLIPDELKKGRTIEGPGACTMCPKRTLNNPDGFPEMQPEAIRARFVAELQDDNQGEPLEEILKQDYIQEELQDALAKADACTDPGCFHRKLKAHLVKIESQVKEKHPGATVVRLSEKALNHYSGTHEKAKASDKGAQLAILQSGEHAGETVYVKPKPKRESGPRYGSDEYKQQQAEEEKKQDREDAIRLAVLKAIRKEVQVFTREDVQQLILSQLEGMYGMDDILCDLHEIKGSGRPSFRLAQRIPKMSAFEFARLIVAMGVMDSDGEIDEKQLAIIAKRYKVDAGKIRSEMEAQFKQQDQPKKDPAPASQLEANKAARLNELEGKKKTPPKKAKPAKTKLTTAAVRKRIAAAQKKRWALHRRQQAKKQESTKK